jgi:antitoxin PrlF
VRASGTLNTRGRTTIPLAVRRALRLAPGGEIGYRIVGERVVLTKAEAGIAGDPFGVFREWASEADRRAYAKLWLRLFAFRS